MTTLIREKYAIPAPAATFVSLVAGDFFLCNGELYQKIEQPQNVEYAVRCGSGVALYFDLATLVSPVEVDILWKLKL